MGRDRALQVLKSVQSSLEARGVAHAALFGSVARDQAHPSSDVDILVTPRQGVRLDLFALGAIQTILEDAFRGLRVDVVAEPIRRPHVRDSINRDRLHAF
jgi:predicted nucleotidyltransferase